MDGAVGVRLAPLRGEQAVNTNQGDLVMDIRRTETPLCVMAGLVQMFPFTKKKMNSVGLLYASSCFVKPERCAPY